MDKNEIVVIFCNSNIAEKLSETDENIKDSLVITDLLPDKDIIVVSKKEFLKWLYEEEVVEWMNIEEE